MKYIQKIYQKAYNCFAVFFTEFKIISLLLIRELKKELIMQKQNYWKVIKEEINEFRDALRFDLIDVKIFYIKNYQIIRFSVLMSSALISLWSTSYLFKYIVYHYNLGILLDAIFKEHLMTVPAPDITGRFDGNNFNQKILNFLYQSEQGAIGLGPDGRLILCKEIFTITEFREELKTFIDLIYDQRGTTERRFSTMSRVEAENKLTIILDSFANYLRSAPFANIYSHSVETKQELYRFYSDNAFNYTGRSDIESLVFNKYWYMYVAVGLIGCYLTAKIGMDNADILITSYFPSPPKT